MADAPGLPTQVYEIVTWKGLQASGADTEMDPRYVTTVTNCDFDYGIVSKRRGTIHVYTLSGACNLIYDFQSQQGFTSTTDNIRTVFVGGATLEVVASFPTSSSLSATFAATNALHYAVTGKAGDCFISNENGGVPKLLFYHGGAFHYISAAFATPTVAPTVAQSSATGSASGTYAAQYTYEDIWGNETNPSPASGTVSVSSGKALDVFVTASGDEACTTINVYVQPPQDSIFYFATSSTNSSATITWTGSDASLIEPAPEENFPCPAGKYVTIYNNMLVVGGDPNVPDALWASTSNFLRTFASAPFFRAVSGDGQPVVGFGKNYDQLSIVKKDSLYLAEGTDDETLAANVHTSEYGALGQPSVVQALQKMVFFSDDGIYVDNSLNPKEASIIIRDYMRTLNPANLASKPPKQFSQTYRYYKKIYFSAREAAGAGDNDTIIVWDYELDYWSRYKDNPYRYLAAIQNADDYEYLYGGDSSGNVYWYMPPNGASPNSDQIGTISTTIAASFQTPWMHLPKLSGMPDWAQRRTVPSYITIYAGGEPAGSNTTISMTVKYYIDFQTTVENTFSLIFPATAWPNKVFGAGTISKFGGLRGTFNWIKLEVGNANLDEHFYIERIVFGFKSKPPSLE